MDALTLPSAEATTKALNSIGTDPDEWRDLVLQALDYATHCLTRENKNAENAESQEAPEESSSSSTERCKETVTYISNALESLHDSLYDDDDDDDEKEEEKEEKMREKEKRRELAEGVLMDALWLVGTMLEPLPVPNDKSAATPSATSEG